MQSLRPPHVEALDHWWKALLAESSWPSPLASRSLLCPSSCSNHAVTFDLDLTVFSKYLCQCLLHYTYD